MTAEEPLRFLNTSNGKESGELFISRIVAHPEEQSVFFRATNGVASQRRVQHLDERLG